MIDTPLFQSLERVKRLEEVWKFFRNSRECYHFFSPLYSPAGSAADEVEELFVAAIGREVQYFKTNIEDWLNIERENKNDRKE